jgi:site-specific DNA recombinase
MVADMRVLGYVRCSSIEQATEGLSLEAQRSKIASWCDVAGATLAEVVEDAGVSGGRRLADRLGGAQIAALLDSRRPSVDAVVVVRLDRLGRDAAETLAYLRRFAAGPVGLVSITDRVDLSTPQGRAMAQLGAVFAELERALIGQRTSEALQLLKSELRPYGPTPFGFAVSDGALRPHASEQQVLRRIARQRSAGGSYQGIAAELNASGVPAKRGGPWHAMSVRSVIRTSAGVGVAP